MVLVRYSDLISNTKSVLIKNGSDIFSADSVALGLSETSLRGVDSHGIRLLPHYLNALKNGRINGKPQFDLKQKFPAFATLDADNAFGHAAGFKSIDIGIDLADKFGMAGISVLNSSHPGAMASFALKAARKGFCAFAFTHADSLIQSFNSKESFFGTNPICFAAPRKNEEPFCLDMAPTFIPWNKILESKEKNENLKENYAVDANGNKTNNPFEARALLPIGNYKGYALASMVEVLCSILSGMNFGPHIPSMYKSPINSPRKLGQFYIVFRSDVNMPISDFEDYLHQMSEEVRAQNTINSNQRVMVPNDPQIEFQNKRGKDGIPISNELYKLIFENN
ncbi:MAG: hypothetical protein CMG00_00190 [Candidatus Marinimicrobia bacterium]|nr:hypothetical protein [Candidatus Neomarinimicrobiota bacterium]|tara:strand:- start:2287 stop:3300 length:1014 start_codon:yes stop_codon:yes gene_type:complete